MTNLKVAVRVRPFSSIEATNDPRATLDWHSESSITLNKLTNTEKYRQYQHEAHPSEAEADIARLFTFDYCFWSGHVSQSDDPASQQTVFETIGAQMLDALFEGVNTSVLAYGQSGTGKTFTMMGTERDPGLAPRLCLEVFNRVDPNNTIRNEYTSKAYFRVEVSFMEIYNEKVRDLLYNNNASAPKKAPVALRIREHPKFGPYVEGLKRLVVSNGHEALSLLHSGMQRRMSAATHANIHSSRSHAIFTIYFTTVQVAGGDTPREITAKLNVVDLAGSERTQRDNVNRVRLKEGALINRSLATLGNVINALAEKSSTYSTAISSTPRLSDLSLSCSVSVESFPSVPSTYCTSGRDRRTPFVPYRNSVLTWILKDSLGGNARTFLVAAVSPYTGAYKETLNTLRFAQRAKLVVNRPVVNEESNIAVIRHLKNEVLRLKTLLNQMLDSKESMNDSIVYTETIIEDSIKVRSPSALEINERKEEMNERNSTEGTYPAKEFKDASAQTVLTLINDQISNDPGSFSEASFEEKDSDLDNTFEVKKNVKDEGETNKGSQRFVMDNLEISRISNAIERAATPSSWLSSTKPSKTNYCYALDERELKTSSTPRSFHQTHRSKQHGKSPLTNLTIAYEDCQSSLKTSQNSLISIAFDKDHKVHGKLNICKNHVELREGRRDSAGTAQYSPGTAIGGDRIFTIVRDVQLSGTSPEAGNENVDRSCLCSAKESYVRVAPSCCYNLEKKKESQLNNFRVSIRQELLAIRRRLVARTASSQVAKTLPYLIEPLYYTYARNPSNDC